MHTRSWALQCEEERLPGRTSTRGICQRNALCHFRRPSAIVLDLHQQYDITPSLELIIGPTQKLRVLLKGWVTEVYRADSLLLSPDPWVLTGIEVQVDSVL